MAAEPFEVPEVKDQVGWRLSEQDKKDLRILMADRREKSPTALLRDVIHEEAEEARKRWLRATERFATKETGG
ncbi:hypothetical protein [Streptomyces misionensis]|uniref:hypothetical protein n=1 Tax=Streptomyces misionensis TaxID=67331 RepID=UPI003697FC4D